MSKSKRIVCLLGLVMLITPTNALSHQLDEYMEENNISRTKEEVEFTSTISEMAMDMDEEEEKEYIGKFTVTFYCGCEQCNGSWTGYPAKNGEELKEGYTIAVDPSVISLNSWVEIDGFGERKACDTGSAIRGNRIDVFMENHNECYELGVKKDINVYLIKE